MIVLQLSGGLGNQMQQYAMYRKLKSLGKDVKLDLSWFDKSTQKIMLAPRDFELSLFKNVDFEECTDSERDYFLKRNIFQKAAGKGLKKLGIWQHENPKVFAESKTLGLEVIH